MPLNPFSLPGGGSLPTGNGLIVGTRLKKYNNNQPIIAALLLSEVVQQGLPGLGAIPAGYNLVPSAAGKKAFLISSLAAVIEMMFLAFPQPPVVTSTAAATVIVREFGEQKVIDAIENASTAGLGPDSGYLFVFENDTLGIPAGQYSIDSVFRSTTSSGNNEAFVMKPSNEWFQHIDWLPWVPNLSWMGDWFLYDEPSGGYNPAAVLDPRSEYNEIELENGSGSGSGSGSGGAPPLTSSTPGSLAPIALAAAGFFLGGPAGAGIGFLLGTLGKR